MKTITEFSGFVLADALKKVAELTPKPVKPKPVKIEPRDTRLQKAEKSVFLVVLALVKPC